jgi:exosome complex component RRP42
MKMQSKMIQDYIRNLVKQDMREDGRKLDEYRDIKIEYGISQKSAEGSVRVTIGDTIVLAGVKMDVGTPFPDTQDEGVLMVGAEFLPLSNPNFESGPPGIDSIELARVVDRAIRESKCIDTKELCIKKGEKVWMVFIDVYPINDDGNLFDAASLAAIAALKDATFPGYDKKEEKVDYTKKTTKKLKLNSVPVECTVLKVADKFVVDPTLNEWGSYDARLTVGTTEKKKICAMQKGGDDALTLEDIDKMMDIAMKKTEELRKVLK